MCKIETSLEITMQKKCKYEHKMNAILLHKITLDSLKCC